VIKRENLLPSTMLEALAFAKFDVLCVIEDVGPGHYQLTSGALRDV
jgi:hypothetical protein